MGFAIGYDTSNPSSLALVNGKGFNPGDVIEDGSGKTWVYVKATAAITIYDTVVYDETYTTVVAPLSTSNDARGDKLGVAAVAFASGEYGFLQIYGPCTINVASAVAANAQLTTTSIVGVLDDSTTASQIVAEGIFVTTANTASLVATAAAVLNWPQVGATLT